MTDEQNEKFRMGYFECRQVLLNQIRQVLCDGGDIREGLHVLVENLESQISDEIWEEVRKEFPNMTREQYEADLNKDAEFIKDKFYHPNGNLKPRLVRGRGFS